MAEPVRVLALMGSGETAPTMVGVHRELAARVPAGWAVLLDTPYQFQENAADVSARARAYFADSVGLSVAVAPRDPDAAADAVRSGAWVFSGPGSPTYALRRWRDGPVARALRDRLRSGPGITVLASAAATTAGVVAVPVYEIYKVGADPYWEPGLDLLAELALPVVVIPHYDNAEGGTHDTRYCYLGERRLSLLERELPPGVGVLGIDEHTAAVVDLAAGGVTVRGRGGLTVRRAGQSVVLPAGSELTLGELRGLVAGTARAALRSGPACRSAPDPAARSLLEITRECERRFATAQEERDGHGMAAAVLDLEAAIRDWAADTEEDEGVDLARDVLRGLIARFGEVAGTGLRDPDEALRPLVDPLVKLRDWLRQQRNYPLADALRAVLTDAGVEVRDGERGTTWSRG